MLFLPSPRVYQVTEKILYFDQLEVILRRLELFLQVATLLSQPNFFYNQVVISSTLSLNYSCNFIEFSNPSQQSNDTNQVFNFTIVKITQILPPCLVDLTL